MNDNQAALLIVDDDPLNIHQLGSILRDFGRLHFALNGPEALAMAETLSPDLILLDVVMPGLDGRAVCARLKASPRTRDIPVIFVTALGQEHDETGCFDAGAADYLVKPVNPSRVRPRVRAHLEAKRSRDLLRRLSTADDLTGIGNRRAFEEALSAEWSRGARNRRPLSVIMADIDCFKGYNDALGHQAGDECLKRVARALAECARRQGDFVARWGGEEFAAILPETDGDGARRVAERMRQAVRRLDLPHPAAAAGGRVTVSLGVAAAVPRAGNKPLALVRQADACLYQAKRNGRDRVVLAPQEEGESAAAPPPLAWSATGPADGPGGPPGGWFGGSRPAAGPAPGH